MRHAGMGESVAQRLAQDAYDPYAAAHQQDPHSTYRRLRDSAPLFYSPRMQAWIVTRYEDVVALLLDNTRVSAVNSIGIDAFESFAPEVQAIFDQGYPRFPGLIEMDPPVHTRYRTLVNTAFTPRRTAALEPRIREIANELIDRFANDGRVEFVRWYAFPLPMTVICEILGVPRDDMLEVQRLADGFRTLEAGTMGQLPIEEQLEVARSFVQFQHYCAGLVESRRRDPRDDLLGVLVATQLDGQRDLTNEELISMIIHLLFAGQETTARVLGSMMLLLLSDRRRWEAVVADPSLSTNVFEEALRLEPPVVFHLRMTREPILIGGVEIPANAPLHLLFTSANHDAKAFPDPDRFDPGRDGLSRHLGFGRGAHFCVGAPVGRLEGRIALETLVERLPGLELDGDGTEPAFESHLMLRGLEQLPLRWDVATHQPRA
jgi:cytochrome P450